MMTKKIILFVLLTVIYHYGFSQVRKNPVGEKLLTKGMRISSSMKIKKQTYKLDSDTSLNRSVIIIEGNNIIVDFNNAVLKGSNKKINPNEFFGVALFIKGGQNITIKNLKARGYKVALLARNVSNLTIDNCDFSYNYRQHLNSTQDKEDVSDWLSHHQNEKDEWLRYGAGMYFRDCDSMTIKNTRVTGGQNALMMTNCNRGMIYNNDFSFNSGLGIGMYRSSFNMIAYNKINFNVRGYSHGVYNRGQDSAGILVYEQSNSNQFYENSVTHGGDGFFLWAGQTTMDSGQGGCNDNTLVRNDFSYAPTNGIEVTFSKNWIISNRIFECDHGIWGGYSYNSVITGNQFRFNRIAIAIEHGQENEIHYNIFFQNKEAIKLWGRKEQPADWGYAKYRDTRSRNYYIANNNFNGNGLVLNLNRTDSLNVFENIYDENEEILKVDSTVTNYDTVIGNMKGLLGQPIEHRSEKLAMIKSRQDPFKGNGAFAGRKNIMITEWGPYDFRYPIIWNTNPTDTTGLMNFDLIGPKGNWKIKRFRGVKDISLKNGTFPARITATKVAGDRTDIFIELEYIGSAITTQFGETIAAGRPFTFSFRKFFQPVSWEVNWYPYDTGFDTIPAYDSPFPYVLIPTKDPFKTEHVNKLDYAWWGGIKGTDGEHKRFITFATGLGDFAEGNYELGVTWDDAVRLYIDEKLVINEWNPSIYKFDESPHKTVKIKLAGRHVFKIEHMELGGFATLSLKIRKL